MGLPLFLAKTHRSLAQREKTMPIRLDHIIVPSRDRKAAAALLADILDVPWSEDTAAGPFSPVYVNDELTLDLGQIMGEFSPQHYCFQVSEAEFDAILGRLVDRGIPYRSTPMGPVDMQVNSFFSGDEVTPSIAALHDGGYVVSWSSSTQDGSCKSRSTATVS